jgi:hypothetical protein
MPHNHQRHHNPQPFTPVTQKEFSKLFSWFCWGEKKKQLEEIKHEPELEKKINKLRFEQELLESRLTDLSERDSYYLTQK